MFQHSELNISISISLTFLYFARLHYFNPVVLYEGT